MSSQQSRNKTKENDLKDWNQSLEYQSLRDGEHESDKKESDIRPGVSMAIISHVCVCNSRC